MVPLLLTLAGLAPGDVPAPVLEPAGMLIRDSTLAGERRADDVVPRHACGLQLARRRWLLVYYTHGFRGVDDERSILYQLRGEAPDGPVLREGFFARVVTDWKPDGVPPAPPGTVYFKQHGHAVAFGVPKGALVGGRPAPHANLFVAQWRVAARVLDVQHDRLEHSKHHPDLLARTADVEWVQFRLNDAEDDLEIVQPVAKLRPRDGRLPAGVAWMNQSFCAPVPADERAEAWLVCNHFDRGRLAVLNLQYDPPSRRYVWAATSPLLSDRAALSEASLARLGTDWLLSARTSGAIAWARAADPRAAWPAVRLTAEPRLSAPHTTYRCADGVVRLFGGDRDASPQKYDRDPMYVWDVSATGDGVRLSNRRVVFDTEAQRLAIRREVRPRVDFATLFPPHGREQIVAFSVTPRGYNFPYEGTAIPPLTAADKAASGLYYVRVCYRHDVPPAWSFE